MTPMIIKYYIIFILRFKFICIFTYFASFYYDVYNTRESNIDTFGTFSSIQITEFLQHDDNNVQLFKCYLKKKKSFYPRESQIIIIIIIIINITRILHEMCNCISIYNTEVQQVRPANRTPKTVLIMRQKCTYNNIYIYLLLQITLVRLFYE